MAQQTQDTLTFHLEGKTHSIDDFTLGELEWLEDELGAALDEVSFTSMKVAVRIVYLLKKRDDSKFTMAQARKLKLSVFDEAEANGNGRPTSAAKGGKRKSASGRRT